MGVRQRKSNPVNGAVSSIGAKTVPMVAVSDTGKARELADRWSKLTQMKVAGIRFALISKDGSVKLI